MDLTNIQEAVGINGVNLSDYFPVKNSYNPVIYMHKKFRSKERKTNREYKKVEKQNSQKEIKKIEKQDKCEQFDYDKIKRENYKTKTKYTDYKDPLMEQTIKFATDIIPLTIPPSTNDIRHPVYYTIKPSQRIKRKHEHCQQNLNHYKDVTFNKQKSKSTIKIVDKEKYKCNEESFSARESVSRSSKSNTLDDINENKSLCFSLSESTERKHCKEDNEKKNKKNDHQKITVSESFEAIAEEYMDTSDAKIKVHLMNDKEKQSLYENIRAPVVRVIKQCFTELQSNNEGNLDLQYLQTAIQTQETKLDRIVGKLDKFEEQLEIFGQILLEKSKKNKVKSSKLEELGQDIIEENNDISSEEELAEVTFMKKRKEMPTPVITMVSEKEGKKRGDDLAKGENVPKNYDVPGPQIGVKPDKLNRIPARYCWTDTVQKM